VKKALLFLLLLDVTTAFAQSEIRLGVNLDPMVSWLSPKTNRIEKDGARPGFGGGLMVEYFFRDHYGLSTGINLGINGGNLLYNDTTTFTTEDGSVRLPAGSSVAFNLSYLTIPIGLKMKTNEIGYFTYFAELGFKQHINVGSRATSTGSSLTKDLVSKEINLFSMSYYFGGGVEYNIGGQTSLLAAIFYNNGFVDVLSHGRHKAAANYLSFRIGILF
jgi:hypothetical protein